MRQRGDAYYLFVVPQFSEGGVEGFMPRNRRFGFVTLSQLDARLVAHEIGHGAFNLRHTFPEVPQGSTDNLMDYAEGNSLLKPQWDLIHNPETTTGLFDDMEDGAVIRKEKVKGYWANVSPTKLFEGKTKLRYNQIFIFDDPYIRNTHTLIKLVDGTRFLVSPLETREVGKVYKMKPEGMDDYYIVNISSFSNDCLSCDLEYIGKEITKLAGQTVGRYIIPIEDGYILITGEDFDGNEASRILAGGFIVLEVIQVGKIFKFAKGTKLLSKTGKPINVSNRVMGQFLKGITDDAIMDISCQFFINLVKESINKPYESDDKIFLEALKQINVRNAVLTGMISYASLDNASKHSFECAKEFFTRMQNGGDQFLIDIGKGTGDCLVQVAVSIAFSNAKGTEGMKKVVAAFSDAAKRDILMRRFKSITSESCFKFIETTVIKSIQQTY